MPKYVAGLLWAGVIVLLARPAGGEPLHALILTGQNNHAWQETTPVLRQILEQSGRFTVETLERPETMTAAFVSKFDVIVSNWNSWGTDAKVKDWPEAARAAFIEFVKQGKGYVSIHAGSSSFYDWGAYQEMVIAAWKLGETGHGSPHNFRVTPTAETHPITQDLPPFTTFDELWHSVPLAQGAKVLATAYSAKESGGTGRDEPVVMTKEFGQGRSVNILLGHDARAMSAPSFGILVSRSAEWAATGKVTLAARTIDWSRDENHLALKLNGETVWQLNFGKDAAKPYFHPLALAGGPILSWNAPPDHAWHHGLWFSWKFINGVNFWEEDPKTGRAAGLTVWDPPDITTKPDGGAEIRFHVRYELPSGEKLLTELRTLTVSPPDKSGGYHIDWTSAFEATAPEALLDRTPLTGEPEGQSWGGYAGLSMRFSAMSNPEVRSDAAVVALDKERASVDAEALDYSGVWDGCAAGVALLQFPGNPLAPTPWYVIAQAKGPFYYFSPAVLYRSPRTLKQGEKLTLRYRIVAHADAWDSSKLRGALKELGGVAKP
ncbi:MAG: PmoA family protein [Candidatus Hydrogenedentes bacterium]|nr:PmoA family protein [Candidatus Hydrogenedentota bacterium]